MKSIVAIKWGHQPRELQLVQVEIVIVDSESCPDHGAIRHTISDYETGSPVVPVWLQYARGIKIGLIDNQRR